MSWLSPPMHVVECFNRCYKACNERLYLNPDRVALRRPQKRQLSIGEFEGLISYIERLVPYIVVLPENFDVLSSPFPYKDLNGHPIDRFLADIGIEPSDFYFRRKLPKAINDTKFWNAVYVIINNYLSFVAWASVESYYTYQHKYMDDPLHIITDDNSTTRTIKRRIFLGSERIEYDFISGKLRLFNNSDKPCLYGNWQLTIPVFLEGGLADGDFRDDAVLAEYKQTFVFNDNTADAPTRAWEFVNKNEFDSYNNVRLFDYLSPPSYFNDNLLSVPGALIKVNADNFYKFRYYDPPE